jgi:hypothetical protein
MIINMTCGGGSADGLNVKIVASETQPSNPQENTIWISTGTPIHGWYFSATEPSGVLNGAVWIRTSSDSSVAFNAAKNAVLMVYPQVCFQRINGAWVEVTAKSYINNGWTDWIIYLYSPGNIHEDLTGGWEGKAHRRQDKVGTWDVGSKSPSVNTQGAEYMEIVLESQQYYNYSGSARTVNKIDLTDFDQISFTLTAAGGSPRGYVTQSPTGYDNVTDVDLGVGTTVLDVSGLSGEYYVGINLLAASATMTVRVTQITVK